MSQERIITEVGANSRIWRGLARRIVGAPFRSEVQEYSDGLVRAEQLLTDGYGLVICANHFSRGDPMHIFNKIIFKSDIMSRRRIAVAVARHQFTSLLKVSGKLLDVQLLPVVTEETIRLGKDHSYHDKGFRYYLINASETLQRAGIVLLFPQGTRQEQLTIPLRRPIGVLAHFLNSKTDRFAFLLIGLGIDGVSDYSREKIGGLNLGKKYQLTIGQTWTYQEVLRQVGAPREVDQWIFTQLRGLVPVNYGRAV